MQARSGMATAALSANQQQALISADMTAPIQAACQLHTQTIAHSQLTGQREYKWAFDTEQNGGIGQ